jgi:hypothetical protein
LRVLVLVRLAELGLLAGLVFPVVLLELAQEPQQGLVYRLVELNFHFDP